MNFELALLLEFSQCVKIWLGFIGKIPKIQPFSKLKVQFQISSFWNVLTFLDFKIREILRTSLGNFSGFLQKKSDTNQCILLICMKKDYQYSQYNIKFTSRLVLSSFARTLGRDTAWLIHFLYLAPKFARSVWNDWFNPLSFGIWSLKNEFFDYYFLFNFPMMTSK